MTAARDAPCVEPLHDGWRPCPDAATWRWTLRARPTGDDARRVNPWGADQLAALLAALGPLARLRELSFTTPPELDVVAAATFQWTPGEPHLGFERAAVELVRTAVLPIAVVRVALDLWAWVRTAAASAPVRRWIGPAMAGVLHPGSGDPRGELHLHHTLFFASAGNAELARLNRPLLHDALAALDRGPGPIDGASGWPGVTRAGLADPPP